MLVIFEIILVAVDHLGFLFETLHSKEARRMRRFNLSQYKGDISTKRDQPLLERLNTEMEYILKLYQRPVTDNEDTDRDEKCSRLLFCFEQIYPELPALYLVIEGIMRSAGLLIKSEQEANKDAVDQINKLDRYSLALMLVAYFQSNDSATHSEELIFRGDKIDANRCPLGRHLIGFLTAYAQPLIDSGGQRVFIGPNVSSQQAGALELKILTDQLGGIGLTLILLDPSESGEAADGFGIDNELERNLIEGHQLDELLLGRPNLVRGVDAREIGSLFGRILDHLENFDSSKEESLVGSFSSLTSSAAEKTDRDIVPADVKRTVSAGSTWQKLNGRKLLTNLLYLALFLLIRSLLLNYLESLQRDLKDRARDDMVQLKHSIMAELPTNEDPIFDEQRPATYDGSAGDVYHKLQVEDDYRAEQSAESGLDGERLAGQPEADVFAEISRLLVMKALGEASGMSIADLMVALKEAEEDMNDEDGDELDENELEDLLSKLMGGQDDLALSQKGDDLEGDKDQSSNGEKEANPLEVDKPMELDGARVEL